MGSKMGSTNSGVLVGLNIIGLVISALPLAVKHISKIISPVPRLIPACVGFRLFIIRIILSVPLGLLSSQFTVPAAKAGFTFSSPV